jgi:hypothetical protein
MASTTMNMNITKTTKITAKERFLNNLKTYGVMGDDGILTFTPEQLQLFLKKRQKKPKTTKAPSAWVLFLSDSKEEIKKEHPDEPLGRGKLLGFAGKKWAEMKETNDPCVAKYELADKV